MANELPNAIYMYIYSWYRMCRNLGTREIMLLYTVHEVYVLTVWYLPTLYRLQGLLNIEYYEMIITFSEFEKDWGRGEKSWPISIHYPEIRLERVSKIHETPSHDSRDPSLDSYRARSKKEFRSVSISANLRCVQEIKVSCTME
jgi:hypothetical protein